MFYKSQRHSFMHNPDVAGAGVFPAMKFLASPWATTAFQWFYPRGASDFVDSQLDKRTIVYTYIPQVILYPAPGEEFSLELDVADALFAQTPTTVSLKVRGHDSHVTDSDLVCLLTPAHSLCNYSIIII